MRRVSSMPRNPRVSNRQPKGTLAFFRREHPGNTIDAHARRSAPGDRVGRRVGGIETFAQQMPLPPVKIRQIERDARSRANCTSGGSGSCRSSARRRIPAAQLAVKENSGDTFPVSTISDKEETSPSLRDRPRKLGNSGILSVKHSPTHGKSTWRSGDDSTLSPPALGDGNFPSGEVREEFGEIFAFVA